jgi:hypothetical protein
MFLLLHTCAGRPHHGLSTPMTPSVMPLVIGLLIQSYCACEAF